MSKQNLYKQCRLQRGNTETVSWIPAESAIVGKVLSLKEHGVWVDDWEVKLASGDSMPYDLIKDQAHNCGNIWEPSALITTRGNK